MNCSQFTPKKQTALNRGLTDRITKILRRGQDRDTHAEPILIFLQLDHLGDRREQHVVQEAHLPPRDHANTMSVEIW